ncbi:MAG: hypothetical protein Q4G62_12310, partial [Pseudomonadota bacterium]|nr:hypothetical protein [Pseudomonadota bacterium]
AERLCFACNQWAVTGFELARANPDARDLFNPDFDAVRQSYPVLEDFLIELLTPVWPTDAHDDLPDIAHMMSTALKGFKTLASDSAELKRMIKQLTAFVAAGANAPHPKQETEQ